MRWKLLFVYFSLGLGFCNAQIDSVFATNMNDDIYGLVRTSYPHVVVPAIYAEISEVKPSCLFRVKSKSGLYGVIDSGGTVKVKPEYADADVKIDHATGKYYVCLKNPGDQILVDEFGNITGRGFPTVKDIIGGNVIVQPDYRDTSEKRIYYTDEDKYVKEGLMDLKGNWIQKPGVKQFHPVSSQLLFVQDYNVDPEKGWLCDLKLNPLPNPKYDDVKYGYSLHNDSLKALKRIIAYDKEFIWTLDSNGKELKREAHQKLPIKIKGYSGERKSFEYNGTPIDADHDFDGAFIRENFLLGFDSTLGITRVYDRKGKFLYEKKYSKLFQPWRRDDDPEYKFIFAQDKTSIYLLDDALEKKTPALEYVNIDDLYKDGQTQLFACKKNNKYGVINQTGKIIVPFIYKNEPSRYTGNVIKVYGKTSLEFYSITGEQLGKDAYDVDGSKAGENIYIVTKGEKFGLFSGNPYKVLVPFGTYASFRDYEEQKVIVATGKDEKKYIFDKNGRLLNKAPAEEVYATHDSVTLVLKYANNKEQLLSYRYSEPKYSFDQIRSFSNEYEKRDYKHSEPPIFIVKNNSRYGLINVKSDLVLDTEWDTIVSYGRCAALKKGRTYFLTNEKLEVDRGLILDSIILETVESPYQDLDWRLFKIKARKAGKWGVFDLVDHKWIIYPVFDNEVKVLGKVNSAQRYYSTQINKWNYLVDPKKGIIYGEGYDSLTPITNHSTARPYPDLNPNLVVSKNGKYGIIDPKGKLLHKCDADVIKPLAYTLQYPREHVFGYLWNIGGKNKQHIWHQGDSVAQEFVDANGNTHIRNVIQGRYYGEHIAGGKFGIVNANGKEILPTIYDDMAFMTQGGEGIGNVRGTYLDTLPIYDHQIFPIFIKKDGKWGVAELNGKIIAPVSYDHVKDAWLNNQRVIRLTKNGLIGYIDLLGNEVLPVMYSGEENYGNYYNKPELLLLQKNGTVTVATASMISSATHTKYDKNGDPYEAYDTLVENLRSFSGGTYGLWDPGTYKWVLEPVYEDIRMLQEYDELKNQRVNTRTSVVRKYCIDCFNFIKGYEPFEIKQNGKWGAYYHGKGIILKPEYDEIKIENEEIITKSAGVEKRFTFEGKPK